MRQAKTDPNTQHFPMRYAFYDRTNIQKFLEQKSEEGWILKTFNNSTFIRTEPKKRHFSIAYYSDKAAKDLSPYERKQEFLEYCRHGGWELVTSTDKLMIFCNEQDSPTPIETDPLMEVNSIHSVAKSHFWGNFIYLSVLAAFLLASMYFDVAYDLTEFLSNSHEWIYILMLVISFSISIREMVVYYRWYHTAKTAAENGQYWEGPKRSDISRIVTVLQSICLIIFILSDRDLPSMMPLVLGFTALFLLVRWILKKCKVSDNIMGGVTLLIFFPLFILFILLCAFFVTGETAYEDLPLSICDLTNANPADYTAKLTKQSTFLVSQQIGRHITEATNDSLPEIRYTVTTVHASFLYDACAKDLLEDQDYASTDADPWYAKEAYCDTQNRVYLLFYEDYIVEIRFTWEPTEEQMAIVGQKLGGE